MIGAKLAALQAALGTRLRELARHEATGEQLGPGPTIPVEITTQGDAIVRLEARMITNSSEVGGDQRPGEDRTPANDELSALDERLSCVCVHARG